MDAADAGGGEDPGTGELGGDHGGGDGEGA
jgi:hypothetical protein